MRGALPGREAAGSHHCIVRVERAKISVTPAAIAVRSMNESIASPRPCLRYAGSTTRQPSSAEVGLYRFSIAVASSAESRVYT